MFDDKLGKFFQWFLVAAIIVISFFGDENVGDNTFHALGLIAVLLLAHILDVLDKSRDDAAAVLAQLKKMDR